MTLLLNFLYCRVAELQSPDISDTTSLEIWNIISQCNPLTILDVTTRRPKQPSQICIYKTELFTDVGFRIFGPSSMFFSIAVVPGKGYAWISRHPTMTALCVHWIADTVASPISSCIRQFNIVFDLDDTLIFNPPLPNPQKAPVMYYANQKPPHTICNDPVDTPVKRPNIQDFLRLVCRYFRNIRVCTLSMRERAQQIVELLDPNKDTLLKNLFEGHKVIIAREDMAQSYSQPAKNHILNGAPPKGFKKSMGGLGLSNDARWTTVIIDDSPGYWPISAKDNIIVITTASDIENLRNPGYLNGSILEGGGIIGRQVLLCLLNLIARSEGVASMVQSLTGGSHPSPPLMKRKHPPTTPKRAPSPTNTPPSPSSPIVKVRRDSPRAESPRPPSPTSARTNYRPLLSARAAPSPRAVTPRPPSPPTLVSHDKSETPRTPPRRPTQSSLTPQTNGSPSRPKTPRAKSTEGLSSVRA